MMKTCYKEKMPEIIRQRRKELGLSQEELAGRVGISTTALGNIERKKSQPKSETARKLERELDLTEGSFGHDEHNEHEFEHQLELEYNEIVLSVIRDLSAKKYSLEQIKDIRSRLNGFNEN